MMDTLYQGMNIISYCSAIPLQWPHILIIKRIVLGSEIYASADRYVNAAFNIVSQLACPNLAHRAQQRQQRLLL